MPAHYTVIELISHFWAKVDKTTSPIGCWLWTGAISSTGYGSFARDSTHRFSYELAYGPINPGLWVLHHCDVKLCVRPEHLFPGTQLDNMRDFSEKGYSRNGRPKEQRGEMNTNARLTDSEVLAIRQLRANGMNCKRIAKQFGINQSSVSRITQRKTWKHL